MRRFLILVGVVLLAGGITGRALSDDASVTDPEGDGSGSVDLIAGAHGHGVARSGSDFEGVDFGGSVIVHEVTTADEWVFQGDALEVRMTSRGWRVPRRLFVRTNADGSLTGAIFSGDYFRGYANVFRSDPATLRIEFPKAVLGDGVKVYRWRVYGTGGSEGCGDADCDRPPPDRLPNDGAIRHRGLWRFRP
jgi:hypothetical protein